SSPFTVRRRDGLFRGPDGYPYRRRDGLQVADTVAADGDGSRLRRRTLVRAFHRVDDDSVVSALDLSARTDSRDRQGSRHRREHQELARDWKPPNWPAVGDRQGHGRSDVGEGALQSARDAKVVARSV